MSDLRGGIGVLDSAASYTSLGPVTSSTYYASPGHTVVSFSVKPTTAGTYIIYAKSGSDTIPLISARTCTANTRDGYAISGGWGGGYVIIFTDTSGGSGTVEFKVEGEGPSMGGWGGGQSA